MSDAKENNAEETRVSNFIRTIMEEDLKSGKHEAIATRFPPEPNGYLHIGHAKAICVNFGLAKDYKGTCNLRFDDTNPAKEDTEYVDAIRNDIAWLGFQWENEYFASDYFQGMYDYAVQLIKDGKAYVCHLTPEQTREYRGTLKEPGKDSPYKSRSVEENLELFQKMTDGEFEEGECVLRAKIDMASPNMNMRDPAVYRIKKAAHHRTGDKWCVYPMYDYAHCLEDMMEGITHSLCSLEFEDHRPLYDWFLDELNTPCHPRQIEFARLNLNYTVMSKRRLLKLVQEGYVSGWDDPRMPTIAGLRRRGYTPHSIRDFCDRIGVSKAYSTVDIAILEHCVREHLNKVAPRRVAVLDPIKVTITNYPEGKEELVEAINNPEDESAGKRMIPFSGELYIERDDFMENPPKKFFRLSPGKEVRFKYGYLVTCNEVIKNDAGEVVELLCTYDPESRGGQSPDGRKVKGTIHWVSAKHCKDIEVRQYDRLFTKSNPEQVEEGHEFTDYINPDSLNVITAKAEPSLVDAEAEWHCQFERLGYFCSDSKDHSNDKPVFNKIVSLKDSYRPGK
jgi:glutaminyl-tRNA synthetase